MLLQQRKRSYARAIPPTKSAANFLDIVYRTGMVSLQEWAGFASAMAQHLPTEKKERALQSNLLKTEYCRSVFTAGTFYTLPTEVANIDALLMRTDWQRPSILQSVGADIEQEAGAH